MSYHMPYLMPQDIHKRSPAKINNIDIIVYKLKFLTLIFNIFFHLFSWMGALGFEPRSAGLFSGHRSSYSSSIR